MSREKQIEEMVNIIANVRPMVFSFGDRQQGRHIYALKSFAEALYNAGYRKQSEGEWIWTENGTEDYEQYWLCSCCNNKSYWKSKFCEECGAKMKGENDDLDV